MSLFFMICLAWQKQQSVPVRHHDFTTSMTSLVFYGPRRHDLPLRDHVLHLRQERDHLRVWLHLLRYLNESEIVFTDSRTRALDKFRQCKLILKQPNRTKIQPSEVY
ncbi:hypothetical protein C2845_PM03G17250 [Panicum miliaceum]|uniref:Uncharacterized protein n=1 Tax=Panicum miliaceum TaxID=4540 RepID=A0A3L6T6Z1_PANMI|nr:hypothetical protein C2845_PM03G17250 [Panicum miliaceum]